MALKILRLEGLQDTRLSELLCQLLETVPGVDHASYDFLSRNLKLELSGRKSADTINEVTALMEKTFPKVGIKYTEVSEILPEPPKPDPIPQADFPFDDSFFEVDEEPPPDEPEKEEQPEEEAEEEDPRKKARRKRMFSSAMVQLIFSGSGLVLSGLLFGFSFLADYGSLLQNILSSTAFLVGAVSLFLTDVVRRSRELLALALLTVLYTGLALFFVDWTGAITALLVSLAGMVVIIYLNVRLQQEVEESIDITPEEIEVVREDRVERLPRSEVMPGMRITVDEGMTFPFSGVLRDGLTEVDAFLRTGSHEPVQILPDEKVHCGDVNLKAAVAMDITSTQEMTTAWKLREFLLGHIQNAGGNLIPRRWTVLLIVTLILLTAGVGTLNLWDLPRSDWMRPALVLLFNASPCGVYAAAVAIRTGGILQAFRKGALINGTESMEQLSQVDTLVSGCGGVFTERDFRVAELDPADEYSENELLWYAALTESGSDHPIARAILEEYEREYGKPVGEDDDVAKFEELPGEGVRAIVKRRLTFVGSARLMREIGTEVPLDETGMVCVYVAIRGEYAGKIVLQEGEHPSALRFAQMVAEQQMDTLLLTGRDGSAAQWAANRYHFRDILAEQNATERAKTMDDLLNKAKQENHRLLYIGDGSDLAVYSAPCVRVLLGAELIKSLLGVPDLILPGGNLDAIFPLIRKCREVSKLSVIGIFAGFACKWVVLGCASFLSLPLFAASLVNILPGIVLFSIACYTAIKN